MSAGASTNLFSSFVGARRISTCTGHGSVVDPLVETYTSVPSGAYAPTEEKRVLTHTGNLFVSEFPPHSLYTVHRTGEKRVIFAFNVTGLPVYTACTISLPT